MNKKEEEEQEKKNKKEMLAGSQSFDTFCTN